MLKSSYSLGIICFFMPGPLHSSQMSQKEAYEALRNAAFTGSIEEIQRMVNSGVDINSRNDYGYTPLIDAAQVGDERAVNILVSMGADVNAESDDGFTPLNLAALYNFSKVMRILLNHYAKPDEKFMKFANNSPTVMNEFTRYNKEKKELANAISQGQLKEYLKNIKKQKLPEELFKAAARNDLEEIQRLVKVLGIDVNAQDEKGRTPIIYAAVNGHIPAVRTLYSLGADVNPAFAYIAIDEDAAPMTTELVSLGAHIDAQRADGRTVLMDAAWLGRIPVVKILVRLGANLNAQDKNGLTALMIAAEHGDVEGVKNLINLGADLNIKDLQGRSALYTASFSRHYPEVAEQLLYAGAQQDAKFLEMVNHFPSSDIIKIIEEYKEAVKKSALFESVIKGDTTGIRQRVEGGIDVNIQNPYSGSTPLTIAAQYGQVESLKELIDLKADIEKKNNKSDMTALEIAAAQNHPLAVLTLLKAGANMSEKFQEIIKNNPEIIKI